ncbi:MAG: DUF721 domain-containing protein [Flavobacteriales bacterium]|nr:MAG: DUF721 domain-containing protein [Flavobacteriales bacterium]|tara:strand:- start:4353 stop:4652 length:300 start_codon:yes stop_codon:yes gene_type:complete
MKKFRFKESHSVRSIIQKISYNKLLSGGLRKVFLNKVWSNVIGENVSQYTENIYIKDNILFLKINSSVLKQELSYGIDKIIENFNKEVGSNEIKKIVFI